VAVWQCALEVLAVNLGFWQGKRVFLTGHTGFKGSWLSLWLQSLGAELTGFALQPPTQPSLFQRAGVERGMRSIIADVRDLPAFRCAMHEAQPEIVIHMAAQPLVRYSYQNPVETYSTNVMGTVHLLEAVRTVATVKAVVIVTSDKCYENREWVWGYREDDPMGGSDPYSSSKGCAELVTSAYRTSYFSPEKYGQHGVALASCRAGNVIGGGDWAADRLIPDVLRAVESGHAVQIRNPAAIRPWQHVLEPLYGYLLLANKLFVEGPGYAQGWNFGPSDEDAKSVQWVVENLVRRWGEGASWRVDPDLHPREANYLKLDSSKARSALGWRPRWNLAEALQLVVDWHKAARQDADMRAVCLRQIADFLRDK
jgi:CDP-glucose 4,6-dehydratase